MDAFSTWLNSDEGWGVVLEALDATSNGQMEAALRKAFQAGVKITQDYYNP